MFGNKKIARIIGGSPKREANNDDGRQIRMRCEAGDDLEDSRNDEAEGVEAALLS